MDVNTGIDLVVGFQDNSTTYIYEDVPGNGSGSLIYGIKDFSNGFVAQTGDILPVVLIGFFVLVAIVASLIFLNKKFNFINLFDSKKHSCINAVGTFCENISLKKTICLFGALFALCVVVMFCFVCAKTAFASEELNVIDDTPQFYADTNRINACINDSDELAISNVFINNPKTNDGIIAFCKVSKMPDIEGLDDVSILIKGVGGTLYDGPVGQTNELINENLLLYSHTTAGLSFAINNLSREEAMSLVGRDAFIISIYTLDAANPTPIRLATTVGGGGGGFSVFDSKSNEDKIVWISYDEPSDTDTGLYSDDLTDLPRCNLEWQEVTADGGNDLHHVCIALFIQGSDVPFKKIYFNVASKINVIRDGGGIFLENPSNDNPYYMNMICEECPEPVLDKKKTIHLPEWASQVTLNYYLRQNGGGVF